MNDTKFMKMALKLAETRVGFTSPNPVVGAVIAKADKIISAAFHEKAGFLHAEARAIKQAGNAAKGAVLYVTLEPCTHFGKTPPCCDAIIESGIKRVVVAVKDYNPLNNGKGIRKLRRAGIEVTTGVFKEEAEYLNRAFFKFITRKIPYVIIKTAQSLDGKIASHTGASKWITSEKARCRAQKLRQRSDAVLVGVNTVIKDNPRLTCRIKPQKLLTKIVMDPRLRTPINANIFKEAKKGILITQKENSPAKKKIYDGKAELIEVDCDKKGRLDLYKALEKIASRDIVNLMVEGGGETIASFIEQKLVDEMFIFIAPKIIGGRLAPTSVEGEGVVDVDKAFCFKNMEVEKVGRDLLLKLKDIL